MKRLLGILIALALYVLWRARKRPLTVDLCGVYDPVGVFNGRPRFQRADGTDIHWEPDGWHIGDEVFRVDEEPPV